MTARKRRFLFIGGGVIGALIAVRLALPFAIRHYVANTLNSLEGYQGSVGKIRLSLLRGAYQIKDLKIWRKGQPERPMVKLPVVDLSVDWRALAQRRLVSRWVLDHPVIDYVKEPGQSNKPPHPDTGKQHRDVGAEKQAKAEKGDWKDRLQKMFPVDIDRLQVKSGKVRLRDPEAKPPSDIRLDDIQLMAHNLSNRPSDKGPLPARVELRATPMGEGDAKLHVRANPLAKTPTFELSLAMTGVPVTSLNPYLREYGKFDASGGEFEFFMEAAAAKGRVKGYVKPVIKDLKILGRHDANPLKKLWKGVIAAGEKLLENKPHRQLAAKLPFEGPVENPEKGLWPAVASVLRNGFVTALSPHLEHTVTEKEVLRAAPGPKPKKK